jgi:ketosteroid isomerase-like protein
MSQENVELWRGVVDDFLVGESAGWEAWLERSRAILDPEIEWDATEAPMPDIADVYHGRDGVLRWWQEWLAAWETLRFEYELLDAGDRVVMLLSQRMRGRSTGIEVPMGNYAHVATFRNGLVVHWKFYGSQSEALAAAGLSESRDPIKES